MYSNYDEKTDTLICPICNRRGLKRLRSHLTNSHSHEITYEEFLEKYPDSKMISEGLKRTYTELHKLDSFREKLLEGIRKRELNKEYVERRNKASIRNINNLNNDPTMKDKISKKSSEVIKRLRQDPTFVEKQRLSASKTITKLNSDPDFILRRHERLKKRHREDKDYSERISKNGFGFKGYYNSKKAGRIFYASNYEKQSYIILDKLLGVKSYYPQEITIPYNYKGDIKSYRPDILVELNCGLYVLIEVKPKYLIENDLNQAKFDSAKEYCNNSDNILEFVVWTEDDLYN